jgi:hypothetical protein
MLKPADNSFVEPAIVRRLATSIVGLLDRVLNKAWPSYALVALLQLKILWDVWRFRDITMGDTMSYFSGAYRWYESFAVNIVWSPLYTSFYGTAFALTRDAYVATILHRVIIAMAATLGVLAVMRKLLPPALALLIAIWWAILPINFETLYEVHLFALLPILAAWLVAASRDTPWGRGVALGVLFGATLLVRNELVVATVLFALVCLIRELSIFRRGEVAAVKFWHDRFASYGVPTLIAAGICVFFYWRSDYKYPEIMAISAGKHTLNMCQVYAFGYQQRHPEWTLSPWLECGQLMESTFGQPLPSLFQMVKANPQAVLEHFLWNLSLVPSGLQLALFNAMSGTVNPDYAAAEQSKAPLLLGLAVLAVVAGGGVAAARHWMHWWPAWFRERQGIWLILLVVAAVAVPVILTQRPRPSYLFATTVVCMAIIGSAVHVLTYRWSFVSKVLAIGSGLALLAFIPPYYIEHQSDRPAYRSLEIIKPFRALIANSGNKSIIGDYDSVVRAYLGLWEVPVSTFDYSIFSRWAPDQALDRFFDQEGINLAYFQPRVLNELRDKPQARQLLERPEAVGWRRLGAGPNSEWLLLYREKANGPSSLHRKP